MSEREGNGMRWKDGVAGGVDKNLTPLILLKRKQIGYDETSKKLVYDTDKECESRLRFSLVFHNYYDVPKVKTFAFKYFVYLCYFTAFVYLINRLYSMCIFDAMCVGRRD